MTESSTTPCLVTCGAYCCGNTLHSILQVSLEPQHINVISYAFMYYVQADIGRSFSFSDFSRIQAGDLLMRTMFDSKMISLIISDYVLIVPTLHHEFCLRTIKVSLVDFLMHTKCM